MTDIEKVRLLTGDKLPATLVFTDAEIQEFINLNGGSVNLAAAALLEAWAAMYAMNPDSEHIGDYSYTQSVVDRMLALAQKLKDKESNTPIMDWAELDFTGETEE